VFESFRRIYPQNFNGRSANRCFAIENWTAPSKMLGPFLRSRIEKRHEFVGKRIMAGHIRSFSCIAISAGQREVVRMSGAAMFDRANVIDFMRQGRLALRQLTVLAGVLRAFEN
jgi:hypothetical protein